MARKANPKVVGIMACPTCSDTMEVREKANGRNLLYTYCPNCKMDQRSGDEIQAFWRSNMSPVGTILDAVPAKTAEQSEVFEATTPTKPVAATAVDDFSDEWTDDELPNQDGSVERIEPNQDDNSIGFGGLLLTGLVTGVLVVCGVKVIRSGAAHG